MAIRKEVAVMRGAVGKVVRLLSKKNVRVVQRGSRACVQYDMRTLEPKIVYIPVIHDQASDEFLAAIQGFVDHEVGHILFTDPAVGSEMKRSRFLNAVEDVRIEREMIKAFPGATTNLNKTRLQLINDVYLPKLESLRTSPDTGLHDYWALLAIPVFRAWGGQIIYQEFMADKWPLVQEVVDKIERYKPYFLKLKSTAEALSLAQLLEKTLYGDKEPPAPEPDEDPSEDHFEKEEFDEPEPEECDAEPESEDGDEDGDEDDSEEEAGSSAPEAPVGDSEDDSDEEPEGEDEEGPGDEDEEIDDGPDESGDGVGEDEGLGEGELDMKDSPEPAGELPDEEADEPDPVASGGEPGPEPSDSDEEEDGVGLSDSDEEEAEPMPATGGGDDVPSDDEADGDSDLRDSPLFSDERDVFDLDEEHEVQKILESMALTEHREDPYVPFTTEYDRVEVYKGYNRNAANLKMVEFQQLVDELTGPLRRHLQRAFVAMNRTRWEGGKRKGKLNARNLARLVTDDPRVFKVKEMQRTKDVAVSMLLDCSGSMGGDRIHVGMLSAWAMSEVLHRLGVNFEVIGFTTHYDREAARYMYDEVQSSGGIYKRWEPLYLPIFKAFGETFTPKCKERMAAYLNEGRLSQNVDGECVQVAAERLMGQPEPGKAMIVLSDGYPACGSVNPGDLYPHLKSTAEMLEKDGVNLVGLGIQSNAVSMFYRKHVVLGDLRDLPREVIKQLSDAVLAR